MKKKNTNVGAADLGSTNSVFSGIDNKGQQVVIPNEDGKLSTPTAVWISRDGSEILVGERAQNMAPLDEGYLLVDFKRDLGKGKTYHKIGDLDITPEWAMGQVLRYLAKCNENYFGEGNAPTEVVATCPVDADEKMRQAIRKIVADCGLNLLRLVNEPTAGGVHYGVDQGADHRNVVVFDWGGATFDLSVLEIRDGEIAVRATMGDNTIGCKEVDEEGISLVIKEIKKQHGLKITKTSHPADYFTIRDKTIRAKEQLSGRDTATIALRIDQKSISVKLTRKTLDGFLKKILKRMKEMTRDALAEAGLAASDVDPVIMLGGGSNLVAVRSLVESTFGKDKIAPRSVSPEHSVALGAALLAAKAVTESGTELVTEENEPISIPEFDYVDVANFSLGIAVQESSTAPRLCSVLLPKNTRLPAEKKKQFASLHAQQERFKFQILQGEQGTPVSECLSVAEKELTLPPRSPEDKSIEISFGYDLSGMVNVEVKDLVSNQSENITVDFTKQKGSEA